MRRYVFADEAGDFAFTRSERASRYFIICTVSMNSCEAGNRLLELRRELAWEGLTLGDYFHATEDKQNVRDRVYQALAQEEFQVQATILEKSKAQPQTRPSSVRFYQYGWFYHLKGAHRKIVGQGDEVLITAASIANKKGQQVFTDAVRDVANQYYRQRVGWRTTHPPCGAEPCLQIADYCTWAIQRKWERNDPRSYDLIKDKVHHEYETWRHGDKHYY